jgi:mRNA-degrading endonuclease YafQ of YafQ-DinJ toxin-antitoxin module
MKFIYSDYFIENVSKLSYEVRKILKEKLSLMYRNPRHPSLRVKKIQGQEDIFEASITMDIRMTWQYIKKDVILLRKIGRHDKTLKNP